MARKRLEDELRKVARRTSQAANTAAKKTAEKTKVKEKNSTPVRNVKNKVQKKAKKTTETAKKQNKTPKKKIANTVKSVNNKIQNSKVVQDTAKKEKATQKAFNIVNNSEDLKARYRTARNNFGRDVGGTLLPDAPYVQNSFDYKRYIDHKDKDGKEHKGNSNLKQMFAIGNTFSKLSGENPDPLTRDEYHTAYTSDPMSLLKADSQSKANYGRWANPLPSKQTEQTDKEIVQDATKKIKEKTRKAGAKQQQTSIYDQSLGLQINREIQLAKQDYNAAKNRGDTKGMEEAHQRAENWRRIKGGYSGGVTGDEYIRPEVDKEDKKLLNAEGERRLASAIMGYENAQTDEERARYAAMGQSIRNDPRFNPARARDLKEDTYDPGAYRGEDDNGRMMYAGTEEERAKEQKQLTAIPKAIGTSIAGSALSLPGTTMRGLHEEAYNDRAGMQARFDAKGGGEVSISAPEKVFTMQDAQNKLNALFDDERYQNASNLLKAKKLARTLGEIKKELPKGQRLLNQSEIYRAQATEGQTGLEKYLTEALITGGEMAPGMIASALTGGAATPGLVTMGLQAAGQTMGTLESQGKSASEALNRGLLSGLIESGTELLPFKQLLKMGKGEGKSFAKELIKELISEVGSEEASEVLGFSVDQYYDNPDLTAETLLENIRKGLLPSMKDTAAISALTALGMGTGAGMIGSRVSEKTLAGMDLTTPSLEEIEAQEKEIQNLINIWESTDARYRERAQNNKDDPRYDKFFLQELDKHEAERNVLKAKMAEVQAMKKMRLGIEAQKELKAQEANAEQIETKEEPQATPEAKSKTALGEFKEKLDSVVAGKTGRADAPLNEIAEYAKNTKDQEEANLLNRLVEAYKEVDYAKHRYDYSEGESVFTANEELKAAEANYEAIAREVDEWEQTRPVQQEPQPQQQAGSNPLLDTIGKRFGAEEQAQTPPQTQAPVQAPTSPVDALQQAAQTQTQEQAPAPVQEQEQPQKADVGLDWNDEYVKTIPAKIAQEIDAVAKALGVHVRFANLNENVDSNDPNAVYDNGYLEDGVVTISRDIVDPIAFIVGHEFTHRMQELAPEEYEIIKNYARSRKELQARFDETAETYRQGGQELDPEKVWDEITADFAGEIINNENLMSDFIRGVSHNPTLLQKIKEFFSELVDKLTGKQRIQVQKAVRMIDEALGASADVIANNEGNDYFASYDIKRDENNDPGQLLQSRDTAILDKEGIEVHEENSSANRRRYSRRTFLNSDYVKDRDNAAKVLAKKLKVSQKKAKKYIDDVNSIAAQIAQDRLRLDYDPNPYLGKPGKKGKDSVLVGNTEYGGSIDFSTICKKRRLYTGTIEAIQSAFPDKALTAEEMLTIRSMMKERGYEVACGMCYVEGSRAQFGKYAQDFIEKLKKEDSMRIPTVAEINTLEGLKKIRREEPELYEAYTKYINSLSQRKPKMFMSDTEYNGEILAFEGKEDKIKKYNDNGGFRLQSFSDFEIIHLIDAMQVIMDMSRVGLMGQAYTKVADFARALGNTGLKINLSMVAKGLDENGRLVFDEVEGMKESEALELRDKHPDTVGTVVVCFTADQIRAALVDERVDFVLPFHHSQWKEEMFSSMGLPEGTRSFQSFQNDYPKTGKKENIKPSEYWNPRKTGRQNAEAYLKLCNEQGRRPKFAKFHGKDYLLVQNKDGTWSLPDGTIGDNYWKLLIDVKMYNHLTGKGAPQKAVRPEFDMEESERMLKDYTGGHEKLPVQQDIVDDFIEMERTKNFLRNGGQLQEGGTVPAQNQQRQHSMSKRRDADYTAAVENGDMDTAQRLVDDAAKEAGYTIKGYHGTDAQFTEFKIGDIGYHVGTEAQAQSRIDATGLRSTQAERQPHVMSLYAKLDNPLYVAFDFGDWHGKNVASMLIETEQWEEGYDDRAEEINARLAEIASMPDGHFTDKTLRDYLKSLNYDGIVYDNQFEDADNYDSFYDSSYIVFDSNQLKSADPITYDDKGEVIPLSERFNPEKNDIRNSKRRAGGTSMHEAIYGKSAPRHSVGAAPSGFDPYTHAANEYGTIEPGENPARMVDVPKSMDGKTRVRRAARTFMEASATEDELIQDFEEMVRTGLFDYDVKKDADSLDRAIRTIEEDGFDGAYDQWKQVVDDKRTGTKDDLVLAQNLYAAAVKAHDYGLAKQLAAEMAAEQTKAGQFIQAARMLKKTSPQGQLYYIRKSVINIENKLKQEGRKPRKGKKGLPDFEGITINEQLADRLLDENLTKKERDKVLDEIYEDIASQIPPTIGDRINAWRYFAMLGNPRTHIRNVVGNAIVQIPLQISDKASALLQAALPQEQRTRALVSSEESKLFAQKDFNEMESVLRDGGKYFSESDIIRRKVKAFKGAIQKAMEANSAALEAEDMFFKRRTYIRSLASFITARGWSPSTMTEAQLEEARTHAIKDAIHATFQDESAFAKAVARIENRNNITKVVVGGILPFKSVPINIAKMGFDLSPLGLVKAITADAAKVRKGTMNATDMVDNLTRGLTGTSIAALGYFLASQGLLTAGGDDDKEEDFELAQGSQNYALNIGGYSYTIDWAAPAAIPLFLGAEFFNQTQDDGEDSEQKFKDGLESLSRMFDPMLNMTVMSGVSGTIKSAAYSQMNPLFPIAWNVAQNYAGQFIPTLSGQVARTVDDTRRTTYVDRDSQLPNSLQKFIQRQGNKIPFVSKNNMPYLDVWGREDVEENPLLRAFENFVSPGYIAKRNTDAVDEELSRLNRLGLEGVLPTKAGTDTKVNDNYLSQEQYETLVKSQGSTARDILSEVVNSPEYQNLTDVEKGNYVKKIFDFSKQIGKLDVGMPEEDADSFVLNAKEGGKTLGLDPAKFLASYVKKLAMDKDEMSSDEKTAAAIDFEISVDEQPGLTDEQRQFIKDKIKFWNTIPVNTDSYNKARDNGMTAEQAKSLMELKKTMDTDNSGGISKDEKIIAIKNSGEPPEVQAMMWESVKDSGDSSTWQDVVAKADEAEKKQKAKQEAYQKFFGNAADPAKIDANIEYIRNEGGGYNVSYTQFNDTMNALGIPKSERPTWFNFYNSQRANPWKKDYYTVAKKKGW